MQSSNSEPEKAKEDKVNRETIKDGRALRLTIDGDIYEISKHKGMSAYTTGQLVKKTLVPLRSSVDKLIAKAFRMMSDEARAEFTALQSDSEKNPKNEDANQERASELLNISAEEYMSAESAAWEKIDPAASEQLILSLFQNILAEGTGYLNSIAAIDKHFDPDIKVERMAHMDILRSEVIKFNRFLDNQRSPLA